MSRSAATPLPAHPPVDRHPTTVIVPTQPSKTEAKTRNQAQGRDQEIGKPLFQRCRRPARYRRRAGRAVSRGGAAHGRRLCGRRRVLRHLGLPDHRPTAARVRAQRTGLVQGLLRSSRTPHHPPGGRGHRGDVDRRMVPNAPALGVPPGTRPAGRGDEHRQLALHRRGQGLPRRGVRRQRCHALLVAFHRGTVLLRLAPSAGRVGRAGQAHAVVYAHGRRLGNRRGHRRLHVRVAALFGHDPPCLYGTTAHGNSASAHSSRWWGRC